MSLTPIDDVPSVRLCQARLRIAAAKASLLAWADESDKQAAERKPTTMLVVGGGLLAILGGLALSRMVSSKGTDEKSVKRNQPVGKTLLGLLLAARVARWIVPMVISAVRSISPGRAQSSQR